MTRLELEDKVLKLKSELARNRKEMQRMKYLLTEAATHLDLWLSNVEGSVGSADCEDYRKQFNKSKRFLNKHFK